MMSDLRESGSLEQDADMVILLHRDDVYEKESTRPGEADLIVAKHRNGPTRDLTVAFQGHYSPLRGHGPGLSAGVRKRRPTSGTAQSGPRGVGARRRHTVVRDPWGTPRTGRPG